MEYACIHTGDQVLDELFGRYPDLRECADDVRSARNLLTSCFAAGGKLLVCGNGGSAADAEHVVGELMKSFRFRRPVDERFAHAYREANGEGAPEWLEGALPAMALSAHAALSTAFANDASPVGVFAQQVYAYGREGDTLLAISTSGGSANVVEAAKVARARGMAVVGLTGAPESPLSRLCDACVRAPESETYKVQELHLPVYHALCAAVEADLFGEAV